MVRLLVLAGLYVAAGVSSVLMVGATVALGGLVATHFFEQAEVTALPTALFLFPSFAALFLAMSGLVRTVERAESAIAWARTARASGTEGQLSVFDGHCGRLSMVADAGSNELV